MNLSFQQLQDLTNTLESLNGSVTNIGFTWSHLGIVTFRHHNEPSMLYCHPDNGWVQLPKEHFEQISKAYSKR